MFSGSAGLSVDQPHPANPLLSHKYLEQRPAGKAGELPLAPRPVQLGAALPQDFESQTHLLMPGGAAPRGMLTGWGSY